jgi:hypothetical protein
MTFQLLRACKFAYITALGAALTTIPAMAYETGTPGALQKPGLTLGGGSAGLPGPGIYMFDQFLTYQAQFKGPNVPSGPSQIANGAAAGFLFVPGWNFLGANYAAVVVLPVYDIAIGAPVNAQPSGMHNTYLVPAELSWKLGDSGLFIKTGLGIYLPDGTIQGPAGVSNVGNPWWTLQPEFIVSYLKGGWNLSANIFAEFNTKNSISGYQSGDIVDAEFTATKTIGKWTFGPVGYVEAQVTNDKSSAYYNYAVNANRYTRIAAGGLLGYNFGSAALNIWVTDEFYTTASGKTPPIGGVDLASIPQGYSVFMSISYRLWAPDEPTTVKRPLFK